jgi:glycerol-3-phosphate cytidylyltransferase
MTVGFIAGAFDVIHPGYIYMFKEAKEYCDYLVVGLHENPEANGKLKPILTLDERTEVLKSITYVDEIYSYNGEDDLYELLQEIDPDVRFLGDDYKGKKVTGEDLNIQIVFLDRSHGWSTTKFKTLIHEQINGKNIQ